MCPNGGRWRAVETDPPILRMGAAKEPPPPSCHSLGRAIDDRRSTKLWGHIDRHPSCSSVERAFPCQSLSGLRGETLWMCVQGRHGGEGTSETPPCPPSCPGLSSVIRQEVTMVSLFPADQLRVVAPGAHHPWKSISSHLPAPREPLTSLY